MRARIGQELVIAAVATLAALALCRRTLAVPGRDPASHPGVVTIEDPGRYARVIAVSDVHGMREPLERLLREGGLIGPDGSWSGGKALLIVIGDSIDKGPDSVGVLDLWIRLQAQAEAAGGRVLHLLGNHEAELLADPTPRNRKAEELFAELRSKGMSVRELTDPRTPRGAFLRSLPLAARVGRWVFCHSGYLPALAWEELGARASRVLGAGDYSAPLLAAERSILEAKGWWKAGSSSRAELLRRLDAIGARGVVFGHQPKALEVAGSAASSRDGRLIKVDHGMAPEAGAHEGGLLVFGSPEQLAGDAPPEAFELVRGGGTGLARERD